LFTLGTRWGWCRHAPAVLSPGKTPTVHIVQESGWAPGTVWADAENFSITGARELDPTVRGEWLYRLSTGPFICGVYTARAKLRAK